MPLDQHWLWGHELIASFTIIKVLGLLCFLIALVRMASRGVSWRQFDSRLVVWFLLFALFLCSSFVRNLEYASTAYGHVVSIITLFVTVSVLIDRQPRLYLTLLTAIGAVGYASLYTIRQQQKYGGIYEGFRAAGLLSDANEY